MKKLLKSLLIGGLALVSVVGIAKAATILGGFQGGTGIGTATSTDVGKVLTVASSSPFLTYTFSTPSAGGSTTTINGASGPTFTFSTSTLGSDFNVSTSGSVITWNLPAKINSLKDIVNTLGTLAVSNGSGTFNSMAPGTNGYSLIASSTAPNGLQWVPRVSSLVAGTGIGVSGSTGDVTISNSGVTSIVAGTNIGTSNSTGTVTVSGKLIPVQWLGYYATSTTNWDDPFFFFNTTSSISKVLVGVKDGSLNGNIYYGTSQTAASSTLFKLFSSDIAITATTTPACYAVATSTACPNAINASSTPGIYNVLRFTASSASTTALTATVYYSEN